MEVTDLSDILNIRTVKMETEANGYDSVTEGEAPDSLATIPQYVTESDLGLMQAGTEILQTPLAVFDAADDDDTMQSNESNDEIIIQLMDIRTRLSKLRSMLEQRLGEDLSDYTFWLQDAKMLENHKTLVEQCIRGEGVVQVNVQIRSAERKINILDVLKPDEEMLQLPQQNDQQYKRIIIINHHHQPINVPTAGAQAFPMDRIGRLGPDPPRGPSADWWVLTTADVAGTNDLTCRSKHGGARDRRFSVTHPMTDHCESCLTSTIAAEHA
ncbi:hypothetical protein evm_012208 [Chilo suppressalis]|nr:hypothetical protein evm_012208 [Chilo suppressalis]